MSARPEAGSSMGPGTQQVNHLLALVYIRSSWGRQTIAPRHTPVCEKGGNIDKSVVCAGMLDSLQACDVLVSGETKATRTYWSEAGSRNRGDLGVRTERETRGGNKTKRSESYALNVRRAFS